MHIQFLGTGAAEGWPAVFCNCGTCNRARKARGKNLRSRASILIDGIYKIDLPPDTYHQMIRDDLDLSALAALFISHSHFDHLSLGELEFLAEPFAYNLKNQPVKIFGSQTAMEKIKAHMSYMIKDNRLPAEIISLEPFTSQKAGQLTFTPIIASHMPDEECFNYIVQSDTHSFLYTADSGTYCERTMEYLSKTKLDMLIAECTLGTLGYEPQGHMTLNAVIDLRDKLVEYGTLEPGARTIITHFSHNIGLLHDELEAIANPKGIEVAYDGMAVEL